MRLSDLGPDKEYIIQAEAKERTEKSSKSRNWGVESGVNDLKGPKVNAYQTAKRFGVLACFAAEAIFPGSFYSTGDFIPKTVHYPGYSKLPDLKKRIQYLTDRYHCPMDKKIDRRAMQRRYIAAVDEIVDLWIAAWKAGGQDVSGLIREGTSVRHENIPLRPGRKAP